MPVVISEDTGRVRIDSTGVAIDTARIFSETRHMLRLDDDLVGFYEVINGHDRLRWVGELAESVATGVSLTDTPDSLMDMPVSLTDAPAALTDAPAALTDAPAALTDAPAALTDAPTALTDAPDSLTDTPD